MDSPVTVMTTRAQEVLKTEYHLKIAERKRRLRFSYNADIQLRSSLHMSFFLYSKAKQNKTYLKSCIKRKTCIQCVQQHSHHHHVPVINLISKCTCMRKIKFQRCRHRHRFHLNSLHSVPVGVPLDLLNPFPEVQIKSNKSQHSYTSRDNFLSRFLNFGLF